MTATLQPVFASLGYTDATQQLALMKLLHAGGAFGDLLPQYGPLDDKTAQGILESLNFADTEQAARWLLVATQKKLLRPKDKERFETTDSDALQKHHDALEQIVSQAGMMSQTQPALQHFDHVLLMGSMEKDVDARLDAILHLWEQGVRFDKIHLLGCERSVVPGVEPSAQTIGPRGQPIRTEMDMIEARYYEKSKHWPKALQDVRVFEVDTFNHVDGSRADTKETAESWLKTKPASGQVLVISNQPLARYQGAAVRAALPKDYIVETMGAAADMPVRISIALDALARQIHVAYPSLLEKLKGESASPYPTLMSVDPASLKLDPETYQFRSGGDALGVTKEERFNTEKWDPILHGNPLLLHERLDGSLYVADGHHRVDLAKRLNAAGTGPGNVLAMVLSEKQGYSAEDVKLIAAFRNIAEGTANVIDAAHVIKEAQSPHIHQALLPKLELDKGNLPDAAALAKLSAEALKSVENGDVPVDRAVKVANTITDPAQQTFAMRVLTEQRKTGVPLR